MSETIQATGACLCGAVKVTVHKMRKDFGACHCDMCRTWGGGPLMASDCGRQVEFEGEEHIGVYSSSDWAERGFCKQCGTHLFYRLKEGPEYHCPVGLFPNIEGMHLKRQVFIEKKPDSYSFADDTTNMTGEELFAAHAASAD
ncbi:MAG: GFA family protein [Gammaproteobacteria bacterium]|nr:GFA family protein [Gammaproteobacteria bacterium]